MAQAGTGWERSLGNASAPVCVFGGPKFKSLEVLQTDDMDQGQGLHYDGGFTTFTNYM